MRKVEELCDRYGLSFRNPWESGRIPEKQFDNFYGRAVPRQRMILEAMTLGTSYSRAYELSASAFDTRCWSKVTKRAGAARGHLLLAAARLAHWRVSFSEPETETLRAMGRRLDAEAVDLSRRLLRCNLQEVAEKPRRSDVPLTEVDLRSRGVVRFQDVQRELNTAITKLAKTTRDLPQMPEELRSAPTVPLAAKTLMEIGRIVRGVQVLDQLLTEPSPAASASVSRGGDTDPWGIGGRYAWAFRDLPPYSQDARRIATHRRPDADALVAAWIAERFLFSAEACEVVFVDRGFDPVGGAYDCVVDVGRQFDPERHVFDHKPPACADRNQTCAAKLIWEHVRNRAGSTGHLDDLVELVHDGDAAARRSRSQQYARSRRTGLHSLIRHAQTCCENDQMLYQAIKICLDDLAAGLTPLGLAPWSELPARSS